MPGDLIAVIFDDREQAEAVFAVLPAMRRPLSSWLQDTIVLTREPGHAIERRRLLEENSQRPAAETAVLWRLAGLVIDEIANDHGGRLQHDDVLAVLSDLGFDPLWLKAIAQGMGSDASALFYLIQGDSDHRAEEAQAILSLFRGKVHRTTLTAGVYDYLVQEVGQLQ